MSNKSIKIAEERRNAKAVGDQNSVRRLNADFQRQARKDKAEYIRKECVRLEDNNKSGSTREVFATIRNLNG